MNLADYLSELLSQQNKVSIPGLGYFERIRVNGYYNDGEAKFYPPRHQVKFVAGTDNDDAFSQYVAEKKNISLASSRYFTEKFISKLKEDAAAGSFLFADLGSFQTEHDQLVFKPNDTIGSDPSFFGFEPVGINKCGQAVYTEAALLADEVNEPIAIKPSDEQTILEEQYVEEDTEMKRSFNIWLTLMIIVTVAALAVFGAYKYDPSIFDRFNIGHDTLPVKKVTAKRVVMMPVAAQNEKADSLRKADSTAKSNAVPATVLTPDTTTYDTLKQLHYVIRVDAFKKHKDANENVNHYKSLGLDAKLQPRAPRHLYKVIVGRYTTHQAAELARRDMVKARKIRKDSKTIKINPTK
jgi:cell division septation protein DedD/nucleoid DNA-binding protein